MRAGRDVSPLVQGAPRRGERRTRFCKRLKRDCSNAWERRCGSWAKAGEDASRSITTAKKTSNGSWKSSWESTTDCRRIAEPDRSEEHTSELQSRENLVCRLLLEKKKKEDTKK